MRGWGSYGDLKSREQSLVTTTEKNMSSMQNSCRLQVLLQHKANLESSLALEEEKDLLKLTSELLKYRVISKEIHNKYASLDQDHLETDVKVRYLLQQVCERVREDNNAYDKLLRVLSKLEGGVKGVCEAMRKELERVEGGKASSGTEVGNEMQLVEQDIPDLVEFLVSGSPYCYYTKVVDIRETIRPCTSD